MVLWESEAPDIAYTKPSTYSLFSSANLSSRRYSSDEMRVPGIDAMPVLCARFDPDAKLTFMVRPATEHDLASIIRIENHAIETSFAHFGTEPVSLELAKESWEAALGRHPWLVKELDFEVVAFARASPWKARQAYQWTTEVGVYVHANQQGKGFGKELYGVLFPELERLGFQTIVAGIALPNEASVRLHEAFGMAHIGTFPNMGFKLGEWRSVGYWVKTLA